MFQSIIKAPNVFYHFFFQVFHRFGVVVVICIFLYQIRASNKNLLDRQIEIKVSHKHMIHNICMMHTSWLAYRVGCVENQNFWNCYRVWCKMLLFWLAIRWKKKFSVIGEHLEVSLICQKSTKSVKSMILLFFSNQIKCFVSMLRYV